MKIAIVSILFLTGCGAISRSITSFTGGLTYKCSKYGVEYVQSDSGLAVAINQDRSVVKCNP